MRVVRWSWKSWGYLFWRTEGSNGIPLNGEPSRSHAFFKMSCCLWRYAVTGKKAVWLSFRGWELENRYLLFRSWQTKALLLFIIHQLLDFGLSFFVQLFHRLLRIHELEIELTLGYQQVLPPSLLSFLQIYLRNRSQKSTVARLATEH